MSAHDPAAAPAPPQRGVFGALAPVAALLIGTGLLCIGYGLQTTLVPLRADAEGFDRFAIGLLGALYYAGFVAGCLIAPFIILRAGHIRAFAAMVSTVSAAALAFPLLIGEGTWLVFRFAFGFCIAGLMVVVESWLNEKSTNATRGVVMSAYVVVTYATITLGQLSVTLAPLEGFAIFSLCSIILSLAAVPVALTKATQPAPIPLVRFRPVRAYLRAPAGIAGTFVSGIMTGSLFSLGAIYAIDSGFSQDEAAIFVSAAIIGGALAQYPIGRVSDYVDRRLVLFIACLATTALAIFLVVATVLNEFVKLTLGLVFGAVMLPTYSLAAAHTYDRSEEGDMVETSVAVLLVFGVGSTVGPIVSSALMGPLGPAGLFVAAAAVSSALALFLALRVLSRGRPSETDRSHFDFYATAPVGGVATPDAYAAPEPPLDNEVPSSDIQREGER